MSGMDDTSTDVNPYTKRMTLGGVYASTLLVWLDDDSGHKFVLSFKHRKDKDHEFHVFFKNGKLEGVAAEHG